MERTSCARGGRVAVDTHGARLQRSGNRWHIYHGTQSHKWVRIGLVLAPVALQTLLIFDRLRNWVPVWAWYPDPGYQYLLAGGQIITGGTPHHNDHPGTSAQWIIGLIEAATHLAAGSSSLRADLIERPEFYAQVVGVVLGCFFLIALAYCGLRLLRYLGVVPSVVFQFLILWGLPILDIGRYRVMPETVVLTAAIVTLGLLAPRLAKEGAKLSSGTVVAIGIVTAIGVTSKVLFAPIFVLALLVMRRREALLFLMSSLAAISLTLIPVYSRMDYMRTWFLGMLFNPGRQGQSGSATNAVTSIIDSLILLNMTVRWFVPVAIVTILIGLTGLVLRRRAIGIWEWRAQAGLLLTLCLVLLASLKEAEMRDFMLAFPMLAAINAVGLYMILGVVHSARWRISIAGIAIVATGFLGAHGLVGAEYNHRALENRLKVSLQIQNLLQSATSRGAWGLGYNVWSEQNAVMFALPWLNGAYDKEVNRRFPQALYFDIWSRVFIRTSGNGSLEFLSCKDLQQLEDSGLGVIVETPNHLQFSSDGRKIRLQEGTAEVEATTTVGVFQAYQLTNIQCLPEVDHDI